MKRELLLGAVAYDPKVVTIWEGFRAWLRGQGLAFDYVLYSNYERQVEDLVAGRIELAWNSPLAWVRARRLARGGGGRAAPGHHARHRLRPDVGRRRPWPTRTCAQRQDLRGRAGRDRGRRLTAGDAAPAVPAARRGPAARLSRRVSGTAVRRRRRPARRPHRRRTRRGPGSGHRRGGRGLHDRRQLAALRPRGRPSLGGRPGHRADPALRPLHDDGGACRRCRPGGHVRRAAAGHVVRATRGCGRCSTWKASSSGGRPGSTATSSSNAPSTSLASTTAAGRSVPATIDLDGLGLDTGGQLLVNRALAPLPPGGRLTVTGRHPALAIHLAAWCRGRGHRLDER